jgi:hypothetical protein
MTHLASELRALYLADPAEAQAQIEDLLNKRFDALTAGERLDEIRKLKDCFSGQNRDNGSFSAEGAGDELKKFIELLLGQRVESTDIDDMQLQEQLCSSLNSIFDSLNQLLQAMKTTFNLKDSRFDETIRHVIREQLVEEQTTGSLEEYIDQIRVSFFKSFDCSKAAYLAIMEKLLSEINPDILLSGAGGGIKLGPLKKAEAFDRYRVVYDSLHGWHESGRGLEEYLRAFENSYSSTEHQ